VENSFRVVEGRGHSKYQDEVEAMKIYKEGARRQRLNENYSGRLVLAFWKIVVLYGSY
jgi:hypothetical protein